MACALAVLGSSWPRCRDLLSSSAELVRAGVQTVELEEAPSDDRNGTRSASSADHRRVAGHVDGRVVARAGRARGPCRGASLPVFAAGELEVALEATTGWRFVVEELQAVGARVHLAEPAETAARRGTKKRAKSDRADARHLRELLMVGRLPESWIPPEHLLELRARVRLRHTLVDQRREWQQRMQAVLYHHGAPPRSWLMSAESRAWLAGLGLPPAAREQITVALAMIDAHDAQLAPLDQELRDYAKRQPGCRALMRHYGIGPLTSITILAELGDARRF